MAVPTHTSNGQTYAPHGPNGPGPSAYAYAYGPYNPYVLVGPVTPAPTPTPVKRKSILATWLDTVVTGVVTVACGALILTASMAAGAAAAHMTVRMLGNTESTSTVAAAAVAAITAGGVVMVVSTATLVALLDAYTWTVATLGRAWSRLRSA